MLLSFNLGLSPSADPVVLRKFAFVALLEGLLCRCNTVSSRTTTQHAPTVNEKQSAPKILSRQQKKSSEPQEHNMTQPVDYFCSRIRLIHPLHRFVGFRFLAASHVCRRTAIDETTC
jgi:hypothetical protein